MTYQAPARVRVYGPDGTGLEGVLPTIGLQATWEVGSAGSLTFDALGSDLDTVNAWDSVVHLELWNGTAFEAVAPYALRRPFVRPVVAATAATSVWKCTGVGLLQKWATEALILPEYTVGTMPAGAGTDRAIGWPSTAYQPGADPNEPWDGCYETSRTSMPPDWPTGSGATWISITGASDESERKLFRTHEDTPLTITTAALVRFYFSSDESAVLYVASESALAWTSSESQGDHFETVDMVLQPGQYAVAVDTQSVWNTGGTGDGIDPILVAAATIVDGAPDTWLLASNETDWVACRRDADPPDNEPPGPTPGAMLRYLVEEVQERNCSGWANVTLGFTDTHDSYEQPWSTVVVERMLRYGSDSLWSVFSALAETGECDTWLGPDLVLHAAPKQTGPTVTLDDTTITSMSETQPEDEGSWAAGLALDGWVYGEQLGVPRREFGMELGTAISRAVADRVVAAALAENGRRDFVAKELLPVTGKRPLLDYTTGSLVAVDYCDLGTDMTVLSITATAADGGIDWEAELVEVPG